MSYLKDLEKLRFNYIGSELTEHQINVRFIRIAEQMQELYPGNYTVEEYFDTTILNWNLRVVFEDKHEETMFMLKYS
jgi:hypothetical protein